MQIVLAFALVALLAASAVFAGVNFSGRFRFGYDFKIPFEGDFSVGSWKAGEAKLTVKATDDNKIWTIALKGTAKNGDFWDSDDVFHANASINIGNMVKYLGGDMGDFGLTISAGNNGDMQGLTVYTGAAGGDHYKFKNAGTDSIQLAMNYGSLIKFNVAIDPIYVKDTNLPSVIVSASSNPIDGLGVSAAYAFNGTEKLYANFSPDNDPNYDVVEAQYWFANGIDAAVVLDIAKMCGMNFDLGVDIHDTFALGVSTAAEYGGADYANLGNFNGLQAAVYGGVDLINAYAEYRLAMFLPEGGNLSMNNGVKVGVKSNCALDGFGLEVTFTMNNFNKADAFAIEGTASYKFGDTGMSVEGTVAYDNAKKQVTITPKMVITF